MASGSLSAAAACAAASATARGGRIPAAAADSRTAALSSTRSPAERVRNDVTLTEVSGEDVSLRVVRAAR